MRYKPVEKVLGRVKGAQAKKRELGKNGMKRKNCKIVNEKRHEIKCEG